MISEQTNKKVSFRAEKNRALGKMIRQLREGKGLTLSALSTEVGISRTYLWQLEKGKRNPSLKIIKKIATSLDVPVSTLINEPQVFQPTTNIPTFPSELFQVIWEIFMRIPQPFQKKATNKMVMACIKTLDEIQPDAPIFFKPEPSNPEHNLVFSIILVFLELRFMQPIPVKDILIPIQHLDQHNSFEITDNIKHMLIKSGFSDLSQNTQVQNEILANLPNLFETNNIDSIFLQLIEFIEQNTTISSRTPSQNLLLQALEREVNNDESGAIDLYTRALQTINDEYELIISGFINLSLGRLYIRRQYSLAIEKLEEALQILGPYLSEKEKFGLHSELGWLCYRTRNYIDAVTYFETIINNSSNNNTILSAYRGLGAVSHTLGNGENAEVYLQAGVDLAEEDNNLVELAWCTYRLAVAVAVTKSNSKAIKILKNALDLTLQLPQKDISLLTQIYNQLGHVSKRQGQFDEALGFHQIALQLQEDQSLDKNNVATAHTIRLIGDVHLSKGDFDKAIYHFAESLKFFDKINITYYQARNYSLLAQTMAHLGLYESSLFYAQKSKEFLKTSENTFQDGIVHDSLGFIYWMVGKTETAQEELTYALDIFRNKINAPYYEARVLYTLGCVYEELEQTNTSSSSQLIEEAEVILKRIEAQIDIIKIERNKRRKLKTR